MEFTDKECPNCGDENISYISPNWVKCGHCDERWEVGKVIGAYNWENICSTLMERYEKKGIYIVDVGQNLIGMSGHTDNSYKAYYGSNRIEALQILENAKEIVTFNGNNYDIKELNNFSKELLGRPFNLSGIHTDIMSACWEFAYGHSLINCFKNLIGEKISFPDSHEGSNQSDVHMTLKLWEFLGKARKNKIHS
jgi:hypothetical protein